MMVPSQRMLFVAAAVALPLATVAGFVPGLAAPCATALALGALVAAVDAVRGRMRLDALDAAAPPVVRLTKDVPARVAVTFASRLREPLAIRLSVAMPPGVVTAPDVAPPECIARTVVPPGVAPPASTLTARFGAVEEPLPNGRGSDLSPERQRGVLIARTFARGQRPSAGPDKFWRPMVGAHGGCPYGGADQGVRPTTVAHQSANTCPSISWTLH